MSKLSLIVLAGGSGTRMWPLTVNKLLTPFFGRPFLLHTLQTLQVAKAVKTVVVASPGLAKTIREKGWAKEAEIVIQPKSLGMADAILRASQVIKGGPAVVVNGGDFFTPPAVRRFLAEADKTTGGLLPAVQVEECFPGGYLETSGKRVTAVIEKPGKGNEPSDKVKAVLDYFTDFNQLITSIRAVSTRRDDRYEQALSRLLTSERFEWAEYHGPWASIKYPWHVLDLMDHFFQSLAPKPFCRSEIPQGVEVKQPVWIEHGVRLFSGAVVRGPVYLASGCVVGNGALVREAMIGSDSVVGFGTEVARSWIGERCWFHSNYIGDSVVADDTSFGAGSLTANVRLDEQPVASNIKGVKTSSGRQKFGAVVGPQARVGVLAALMPGVKIGTKTVIGPGTVVGQDVPDGMVVFGRQELTVKPNRNRKLPSRSNRRL